jgi:multiple sugar transport system substrate-binding protein
MTLHVRISTLVLFAGVLLYWLFADTLSRHGKIKDEQPLVVAHWGGYQAYQMWKEIFAAFRLKHPEIEFESRHMPSTRYHQKIQQQIVSDTAPDLFMMENESFPKLIKSGKIENISPFVKAMGRWGEDGEDLRNQYWNTAIRDFGEFNSANGDWEQWGMPLYGGCNLLFYNKANWSRAQIRVSENPDSPGLIKSNSGWWYVNDEKWNLDEFIAVCKRLTIDLDGDGRIDQYGLFVPQKHWQTFHWIMGASFLDETYTRSTFYGPECEASLGLWQDFHLKSKVMPTPSALSALNTNTGFFTGMISILNTNTSALMFLNATEVDYDTLHLPRGSSGRRYTRFFWEGMAMSSLSQKKAEAWIMLDFLTSIEAQKIIADYQMSLPSLIASEPYFLKGGKDQARDVDLHKFIEAAESYARRQPISLHWGPMTRALTRCWESLISQNEEFRMTPRQAIARYLFESPDLSEKLPPIDPAAAEEYRPDWEAIR